MEMKNGVPFHKKDTPFTFRPNLFNRASDDFTIVSSKRYHWIA
jgi:hypothetical protein